MTLKFPSGFQNIFQGIFKNSPNDGDTAIYEAGKLISKEINTYRIPACAFSSLDERTEPITYAEGYLTDSNNTGFSIIAPIQLPQGAKILSVIVFGNAGATGETYILQQWDNANNPGATVATANVGTEDTTINHVVDNTNGSYVLGVESLDNNDLIFGARIIYTFEK